MGFLLLKGQTAAAFTVPRALADFTLSGKNRRVRIVAFGLA
jgi:hypothetical protein